MYLTFFVTFFIISLYLAEAGKNGRYLSQMISKTIEINISDNLYQFTAQYRCKKLKHKFWIETTNNIVCNIYRHTLILQLSDIQLHSASKIDVYNFSSPSDLDYDWMTLFSNKNKNEIVLSINCTFTYYPLSTSDRRRFTSHVPFEKIMHINDSNSFKNNNTSTKH
jgi:hypothetical protein